MHQKRKLHWRREYWYGYTSFYISLREWKPLPMWASDPTVDPENWRSYSYCDTAEGTKQTAHLYYWFGVTNVLLYDFNGTFSACLLGFVPENVLNFLVLKNTLLCQGLFVAIELGYLLDFLWCRRCRRSDVACMHSSWHSYPSCCSVICC